MAVFGRKQIYVKKVELQYLLSHIYCPKYYEEIVLATH